MNKIKLNLLLLFALCIPISAQLTIEECQEKARENYPLIRQYALIDKSEEFTLSNANKAYLPQLSLSAKASYQSAVTKVPIDIPGVGSPSKDQYGAEISLNQTIWDGGNIKNQKERAEASSNVQRKELEANLYQITDRVNELYFGILLLDAQLEQNRLFEEDLERNMLRIENQISQGMANNADLDIIKVEILNSKQSKTIIAANKRAFLEMLSQFVGEKIGDSHKFIFPSYNNHSISREIKRPELAMFDSKLHELDTYKDRLKVSYMPKFDAFATGGYGRPGLNMLKDKFDTYYIAGVRMAWNFGSLYTKSNDKKLIEIKQENVEIEKSTFLFNAEMEISQEDNAIAKNRELLKHDDEIIRLRTNVRKAAEVKLENGIMSATDFMREMTAEDMAKQNKIAHEMELLMTIYKHKFITNN